MKNATIYRTTDVSQLNDFPLGEDWPLADALAEHPARDLGDAEARHSGFVPPLPGNGSLCVGLSGYIAVAVRFDERKIPAAAVRARVQRLVETEEKTTGLRVTRAERQQLKESVYDQMLPGIPPTVSTIRAYIDTRRHLIVVDTSSRKRAEDVLDRLRQALGSLKVVPLAGTQRPVRVMTDWLHGDSAAGFALGTDAVLSGSDGHKITFKASSSLTDEARDHLVAGMQCTALALRLDLVGSLTLVDDLRLTGIKFDDALLEAAEQDAEDVAAAAQGTFLAEAAALGEILAQLDGPLGLQVGQALAVERDEDAEVDTETADAIGEPA